MKLKELVKIMPEYPFYIEIVDSYNTMLTTKMKEHIPEYMLESEIKSVSNTVVKTEKDFDAKLKIELK